MGGLLFAHLFVQFFALDVNLHLLGHPLFVGREEVELLFVDVVHAFELSSLSDGPTQWAHLDLEFFLQFVQHVERVTPFTIHLVDEDNHRRLAHAAHLHQLTGLCLHTFGRIDHDDGRVNGREGAVSVLSKVLVARRVENVDLVAFIIKFHDRG